MIRPTLVFHASSVAALAVSALLYAQLREARHETAALQLQLQKQLAAPPVTERVELADIMEKLQRHSTKLYFAGKEENWPLAAFYVEELEEVVESIAHQQVFEGQINISGLMPGLLVPEIEKIEASLESRQAGDFVAHYRSLTAACNACHVATQHPFIVIQEPRAPALGNQRYDAQPAVAVHSPH